MIFLNNDDSDPKSMCWVILVTKASIYASFTQISYVKVYNTTDLKPTPKDNEVITQKSTYPLLVAVTVSMPLQTGSE